MALVTVALMGLLFGSFANVLIARIPDGKDWVKDSSKCPRCAHEIAWYDNVPVVSWLLLRARCRNCSLPISWRYPVVEIATSLMFLAVYLTFGLSVTALAFAYLALISVALFLIDIDVMRLPDAIVLPAYPASLVLLSLAAWESGEWSRLPTMLGGMAVMGGFYGLMVLAYPKGMGLGDVKLAGLLGLFAGFLGWGIVAVALILGPLVGGVVVVVAMSVQRMGRKTAVPYGPALLLGGWIAYLWGSGLSHWYLSLFG